MSTSPAATVTEQHSAPDTVIDPKADRIAALIALVLLPLAIYAAFALHLGVWAGLGFCVIVPSVIASTVGRMISAARA